jgi:plastocyanin
MASPRIYLLSILLIGLSLGCDDRHTAPSAPSTAPVTGSATITGHIALQGTPPVLAPVDVSAVADCARLHPHGVPNESVVVSPDGALQNVIVYLKGLPAVGTGASRSPVILNQVGCQYTPHVVAVQTGQILRVQSEDPFMHNVNVRSMENNPSNFAQLASPGTTPTRDLTFTVPEIFPVQCDVHPWMRAWIGVFDHPYFAVTDANGDFRIDHVPAGTFTIVAWQERLGEITQQVAAGEGTTGKIDMKFSR